MDSLIPSNSLITFLTHPLTSLLPISSTSPTKSATESTASITDFGPCLANNSGCEFIIRFNIALTTGLFCPDPSATSFFILSSCFANNDFMSAASLASRAAFAATFSFSDILGALSPLSRSK